MSQAVGYHGVDAAKYKSRSGTAAVTDMAFIKNISLDRQVSKTAQYANNRMVCNLPKDNGYTGNLGTTAQDTAFETALGMIVTLDSGAQATVSRGSIPRMDFYYEFAQVNESGVSEIVKVWLLNVEFTEPSLNNATDQESHTFGDYIYPFTVYGDRLKANSGSADYVDDNGNKLNCYRIMSFPDDDGYAAFGATVPVPKMPAEA